MPTADTRGSVARALLPDPRLSPTILRLAAPVVLAMLTQTAINLADTIMVGYLPKHVSIAGQSAIGYSLIVLWSMGGFLSALGIGTQALVARRFGEGRDRAAGAVLGNGLVIAFLSSAILVAGVWPFIEDIYRFLSPSEEVVRVGAAYCRWRLLAVPSMVATAVYKAFFDGLGRTRVHMGAALAMNLLNLALNYILIFGAGPIEGMQVSGAGLASTLASYVGLGIMVAWSFRSRYRTRHPYLHRRGFSRKTCWEILRLSVPSGVATVVVMTGFALFFKVVGIMDSAEMTAVLGESVGSGAALRQIIDHPPNLYVAAFLARPPIYTAAAKVITDMLSIAFMSSIALGTATATLVGQNLGRGEPDMAERYGFTSIKIAVWVMLVLGGLVILFPDPVIGAFSKDAEVIEAARMAARVAAGSAFMIAAGLVGAQALFGAGNSRYVMIVETVLHFTCLVPLAWLLGVFLDIGIVGAFLALTAYSFLLALFMVLKFREGRWKQIRI